MLEFAAAAPILLILGLMLALQWSAARAGLVAPALAAWLVVVLRRRSGGGQVPGLTRALTPCAVLVALVVVTRVVPSLAHALGAVAVEWRLFDRYQGRMQPLTSIVTAPGFAAAVGNIVCPHHNVAGADTVGLAGREAAVLRRTLLPCLPCLALGGAAIAALAAAGQA